MASFVEKHLHIMPSFWFISLSCKTFLKCTALSENKEALLALIGMRNNVQLGQEVKNSVMNS
ncbi:hypothetical protein, partial [Pasteurella multocida]